VISIGDAVASLKGLELTTIDEAAAQQAGSRSPHLCGSSADYRRNFTNMARSDSTEM